MRTHIRNWFTAALAMLARAAVRRHKPTIIMVTGSVGKTSTKDAVAAALSGAATGAPNGAPVVRKSEKSFNSEIGVPLTIIGAKNPWSNPFAWLGVLCKGFSTAYIPYISRAYPEILVLEVGADKPGDLAGILKIATPNAVVVTLLPEIPVHVQFYDSTDAVRREEFSPATALPQGAPLVISADDLHAQQLAAGLMKETPITTFGYAQSADVRISDISVAMKEGSQMPIGMQANLVITDAAGAVQSYPLVLEGIFGRSAFSAPAAGLTLALAMKVPAMDALRGLKSYVPPAGRGKIFAGIHNSVLIDDSYNSSPVAVEEALASLALLNNPRKIAILGDMLELGEYTKQEHERIGLLAAESVDVLIAVGTQAQSIVRGAIVAGMAEQLVLQFATSTEAAEAIPALIKEGDAVLVKGSQGVRLERVSRALLANPADAQGLVRQDAAWRKR